MKILHTSDLHIGLKLIQKDLQKDQEHILREMVEMAKQEKPDAFLIAGDVYDKSVPSAEAVAVFDRFMEDLRGAVPAMEIMVISGNHDSGPRLDMFRKILQKQRVHMVGMPPAKQEDFIEKITLTDAFGPVYFYLLPFVKPSMVKEITGVDEKGNNLTYDAAVHALIEREQINTSERNVLVSHQFYLPVGKSADEVERMDSELPTVGNIDAVRSDILERFDYAALGHVHKPMKVGSDFLRFSGTPLACSVSEAGQPKGMLKIELGAKGERAVSVLPFHPLHQVRILEDSFENICSQGCEDYVSLRLTDTVDLDVIDMQDRLRKAFPNLLEIRRTFHQKGDWEQTKKQLEQEMKPYDICRSFFGEMDEEQEALLQEIINDVIEGKE